MTRVGRLPGNIEIRIYTDDPGQVPHFHVLGEGLDACIRIDEASYFPHNRHTGRLNSKQVRDVVRFLKSEYRTRDMTNWQRIVDLWNDNNSNAELPDDFPMPDYLHGLNTP